MNFMGLTIRVGLPTAVDPEGNNGPGYWWITGHARPGLMPESQRRAMRGRRRFRLRRRPR